MKKETKAMKRLDQSRKEARARLEDLRRAIDREVGWVPRQIWWLPLVGFACGVALAGAVGRKRRQERRSE
jgi:hypothetical protein